MAAVAPARLVRDGTRSPHGLSSRRCAEAHFRQRGAAGIVEATGAAVGDGQVGEEGRDMGGEGWRKRGVRRSSPGTARVVGTVLAAVLAAAAGLAQQTEVRTADGLAVAVSPVGQVTSVRIGGVEVAGGPAPLMVLRDLSAAGSVFDPNLLANPGFENGLSGWQEVQSDGVHGALTGETARSGAGALELAGGAQDEPGWAAWAADPVAVSPGQRLRVGAWWKSPEGFLVEDSGTAPVLQMLQWRKRQGHTGLYVQWLDATGKPLDAGGLAVALHLNCSTWRLIRRELVVPEGAAAVRVIVGAKLSGETVAVDDVSLVPATEPERAVVGTVAPCPGEDDCLDLTGAELDGLRVAARITGGGAIRVDGTVSDTSGTDRAFDLTVEVPVAADEGWTWWDDAHVSRPVAGAGRFEHEVSAIVDGWLPVSLYPYGGLGSLADGTGVALALPPDTPQLAEIAYDASRRVLGVTFHMGISPAAVQLGGTAAFHAAILRVDPEWGFRDLMARFQKLFPEAFASHVRVYGFSGRSQGYYYTPAGAAEVLAEDGTNTYSAQYTSSDLAVKVVPAGNPRPVLDDLLGTVDELAASPEDRTRAFARAIRSSAVVDTDGEWALKAVHVPVWAEEWWEAAWVADMDPEIEGGLAQWNLSYRIDAAFAACQVIGAHLDGVQIDNFMSTPTFDFRPEALAAAGETLGYSPHTYRPAVHNGFAVWEYLRWLRRHLDTVWGTDRGITVNFWGIAHPNYLAPFLDAFGSEGNLAPDGTGVNWNLEIEDYRRAVAGPRPYLFTDQTVGLTAEQARRFTGPAILFGVPSYPGPNSRDWEPGAEQEVERATGLVFSFWAAGWEPLTFARAT
ncbi:MAG TPA: hypothetical protein ENK19_03275, partial [Acidobacteria bacterium]|nr:hypothetical protein [Acidobacteriota bacterium]